MNATVFSDDELRFLTTPGRQLGRIATVGPDGTPHVMPSGWEFNTALGTIDVTGRDVQATKKFRDVTHSGNAAIVIDGLATGKGWRPWAIEVAGQAEAITGPPSVIRIHPARVRSWGLPVT
jgi:pyridoxamine 5'-phosphate oxidase family protein